MENIIDTIRAATSTDATDEARAAAAHACRTLLATLEKPTAATATPVGAPVEPNSSPSLAVPAHAPMSGAAAAALVQSIATVVRGMSPDQLLDLAIVKLRGALPPNTEIKPARGVTFPMVPVQHLTPNGGPS